MHGSQPTSLDVDALESLKADEAQISALNHPRVFGWYSFISKFSDAKKAQLPQVAAPVAKAAPVPENVDASLYVPFSVGDIKITNSVPDNKPPSQEDTIEGRYATVLFVAASE